ncbi:energy-coupling factor transporter transmembrane component T family protein [Weissella tructae]|uniref:Energy-coupling factor transporter transmembrane protein EcfT n=2 Tax=Weissella TaxID=46255 RepID=A0A075U0H1_9LACO|nr:MULTISPECIES: energy-coupling factor transporter transmembrane component T [Weissella]AIG65981.1 Energy-coupling factor transporter transmembrane protein EcfT [Weissella tructae]AIM63361.1 Energy-coupling factor transporter transmembrane protein EcfT [Weissella ceti]AIM64695.1 Energy-coupling factor transporter transmembrane protein EcfT [Weissella ceti]ELA07352.1 cobalt ABC transporter permease CbiQ-like transporter [Weissella ceti NC36]QVV91136.1 energy-coupling factor transporter transme
MGKLIIGRYLPGNSWVHQLDPRTKFVLSFSFIFIIFMADNAWGYLVATVFTFLSIALTGLGFGVFLKGLRPIALLMLLTTVLQLFFIQTGPVWVDLGGVRITQDGVINSLIVFVRFMLIIMFSTILTLTTPPLLVANAMESLLAPLKKLHVPVAELALMVSIALRFVPTLMDEAENIMNAQRARGVKFNEGNLFQRAKSYVPLMIPLFVNAIKRAIELGDAMEARGYRDSEDRSRYRVLESSYKDVVAYAGFFIFGIALFATRFI